MIPAFSTIRMTGGKSTLERVAYLVESGFVLLVVPFIYTPVSLHSSATKRPSMPYTAHLDIRRQIGDVGTRLELVESWAVAHTPEIVIGRILDLHAQRCRCTPQFESVTATHEEHRLCRKLRHIINAGRGSTKV